MSRIQAPVLEMSTTLSTGRIEGVLLLAIAAVKMM